MSNPATQPEMDFLDDLVTEIEQILVADGFTVKPELKSDPVVFLARYIESQRRQISSTKRNVLMSQSLLGSAEYTDHKVAIDNLKKISEDGGDLTPYQSKSISKFEYSEFLLFDWGIQHLHLGSHRSSEEFADRTGPLLFAILGEQDAYFIAVLSHGKWAELDLFNIVDNEWPNLLAPFVLKGVLDIDPIPSAEDTLKLRKAGINVLQKLNSGKIINSPGGGITTARTSLSAMTEAQNLAHLVWELEESVGNNKPAILNALGGNPGDRIKMKGISLPEKAVMVTIDGKKVYRFNFHES